LVYDRSTNRPPGAAGGVGGTAYAPEDWERLVELKERYDPDNLFRFNRNIPPSSAAR
jgi:FAD/FMN-containing dehydrogenase